MNLSDLKNLLEGSGYPVAYSHFIESENTPYPDPPFLVYLVTRNSNFNADNKSYHKILVVQIELYTKTKDPLAEEKVESILDAADLPFDSTESYIESEQIYQKIYEVRMV